jgi:hypothetical protein
MDIMTKSERIPWLQRELQNILEKATELLETGSIEFELYWN